MIMTRSKRVLAEEFALRGQFSNSSELKAIKHPGSTNGMEKRSSTGSSSERPSYPIPEAQDYQSQPGDIKMYFL